MDVTINLGGTQNTDAGNIKAQKMGREGECLLVDIKTDLISMGEKIPYEICRIYFQGSVKCLRVFGEAILAALPDEQPNTEELRLRPAEELRPAVMSAILGHVEAQEDLPASLCMNGYSERRPEEEEVVF
jgi:hypothetical protein